MTEIPSFKDVMSFRKTPTVVTGDQGESTMLQDHSGKGAYDRHAKYVELKDEIDANPNIKPGDKMQNGKYTYVSDYPPGQLQVFGRNDVNKPLTIHRDGSTENSYSKLVPYDAIEDTRKKHEAKQKAADMLSDDKGVFGTMVSAALNPRDASSTAQERASNALQERQKKIDSAKQMLIDAGYSSEEVEQMFGKPTSSDSKIGKAIPSFREMMGQESIAKKIRTTQPESEWSDQFELYLNMYPDKRKEIEENAAFIGGPMSYRIARDNAMERWIKENRQALRDAESYSGPKMGASYNQGIESGKGTFGAGIRPNGSPI